MDATGEIARPTSRDYPLLSADCHISAPHELYAQLPEELHPLRPVSNSAVM
jgi:hypothetical protein